VAISPVPIIAVVLMLATPRGRVNGPAFLGGWLLGLAAGTLLYCLVPVLGVTLIGALRKYGLKRGVASLCIGGGEATAMGIELV